MRVRIQYSVELDEIPQKISGFLREAAALLEASRGDLEDEASSMTKGRISEPLLEEIDAIRQNMAKADIILADSHSILSGFLQAKSPPAPEALEMRQPEVPNVVPEG